MNPELQAIMAKYKYNPANAKLPSATESPTNSLVSEFDNYIASSPTAQQQQKKQPTFLESIGEATGIKGFGEAIGTAIAAPEEIKRLEQSQQALIDSQTRLLERRKQRKAEGADTSRLDEALKSVSERIRQQGAGAVSQLTNDITDEDIIGDALKLAGTVAGFASVPGVSAAAKGATGVLQGAKLSALEGAISGATSGVIGGAGTAIKEQQDIGAGAKGAISGGIAGGIGGAVGGALIGGITGGLKGRALRKNVFDAQVSSGEKPPIDLKKGTITTFNEATGEPVVKPINSVQKKAIKLAKEQGFDDTDTAFVLSLKPADKAKAARALEIAEKSLTDKRSRALFRPEDVLGESFVEKVKNIDNLNSTAGQRVDEVARGLRGQQIDASAVKTTALNQLQDAGVSIVDDGTLDFSNSIFKKTPELARKIKAAFSDLPDGVMDAEQLHLFKKSIDQIVEYGKTSGKAFTSKAESILKGARAAADDVLDTTFADYNAANTDFKVTKEVLDELESLFGKKVGFTQERGGQILRGIFSNNQSRSRLLQILPQIEQVATKYGINTPDNLIDQAIFVDLLEDVYGTQATTSLQGQVGRGVRQAVGTTQKVIAGLRSPIEGAGELAATVAEKATNVSPEQKRQVLRSLLGDLSEKPVRKSNMLPGFVGNKGLTDEAKDQLMKNLYELKEKGFNPEKGNINLDSWQEMNDLIALSEKRQLKHDEFKQVAELLQRQGSRVPILGRKL